MANNSFPPSDTTFELEGVFSNPVVVTLIPGISDEQLRGFPAFQTWMAALKTNLELQYTQKEHPFRERPYTLESIEMQSVDWFGKNKIGFIKFKATVSNGKNDLPGVVFLRGGSVAMLMILRPIDSMDEKWVVLTEQPRIPAGSLRFWEIPAGMLEGEEIKGKAVQEIEEETGFILSKHELIDLTELALKRSKAPEKVLQTAMYPSPGGSDEFIPIFLWEKELERREIEDLNAKLTGERKQNEMITLRICAYEELWREGARDAKTLAAWALYEGLNRSGEIEKEVMERRKHRGSIVSTVGSKTEESLTLLPSMRPTEAK
jgi:ADP-sugar diphosphatase